MKDEFSPTFDMAQRRLQSFLGSLGPAGKQVDSLANQMASVGGKATMVGGALLAVTGPLFGMGVAAIKTAGEFEQTTIAFNTMLGSASKAKVFLKELADFAAATPFQFPTLVQASQQLLAMGFSAEKIIPMMTGIGNAVAGLGGGDEMISRVTRALGQMQAKGKVTAEEMMQLAETGIPVWKLLADNLGITIPEAMAKSAKGLISAQVGVQAIVTGMNTQFGSLMEKQSQTMLGKMSTIKDNMTFALRDIGMALLPLAKDGVDLLTAIVPILQKMAQWFADLPRPVQLTAVAIIAVGTAVGALGVAFGPLLIGMSSFMTMAGLGTITMAGFTASLGAATIAAITLAAQIAMVGAAFKIGWEVGSALDRKLQEMDQNIETITGEAKEFEDSMGTNGLALVDWTDKMKLSNDQAKLSQERWATLHPEVKKSTAATTDNVRATLEAAHNTKLLKQASDLLGKSVTDVSEAKRVLKINTELTSTALSKEAQAAVAATEAHKQLVKSYQEQNTEAGKAAEAQKQYNIMLEALGPLANVGAKDLQTASDKLREMGNVGVGLANQLELAWHDAGGKLVSDTVAWADSWDIVKLKMGGAFANLGGVVATATDTLGAAKEKLRIASSNAAIVAATSFSTQFKTALGNLPSVILGAIQGGGNVWKAVASSISGSIFGKDSALVAGATDFLMNHLGEKVGSAIGSILPGIGAVVGPALGALAGKIFGGLFGGEGKKVNDMRDKFIESAGGLAVLNAKAAEAGMTLDKLLAAKKVTDFDAAVAQLNAGFDALAAKTALTAEANDALNAAIEKYGFTVDQLGPKWKQQELDKMAAGLLQDYKLLTASGIDNLLVIEKMGPALSDYVNTAVAGGVAIPEAMRPMIDKAIENKQLLDENGNAYKSAEEAGITYTKTMSEMFTTLLDKINKLVNALLGIGDVDVQPKVTIPDFHPPGEFRNMPEAEFGAVVTNWAKPYLLHGTPSRPEYVVPHDMMQNIVQDSFNAGSQKSGNTQAQVNGPVVVQPHFTISIGNRNVHDYVVTMREAGY